MDIESTLRKLYSPEITTEQVTEIYDKWSDNYDEVVKPSYNGPKLVLDALSEVVTDKHVRILDCACGTGLIGETLRESGFGNIDGVDMSEGQLRIARKKGIYRKTIIAVLGPESIEGVETDSYDVITCSGSFGGGGQLNDGVLQEWTRIVKPGGYIILVVHENYRNLVEGDTFKRLLESKAMTLVKSCFVDHYVINLDERNARAFVYTLKVLASKP
ncbi:methyltransferase-like protein 27 [Ptychodera flava]|uniref:methyltransferase-like protein 27 n=1 Tax=Ptychodera flava TaxID=63121 RepID=UPI00396AA133